MINSHKLNKSLKIILVVFALQRTVFKIIDFISNESKNAVEEWFTDDIELSTSDTLVGGVIVLDFAYTVSSVIEYTLDGGTVWIAINSAEAVSGGQSRYIRVSDGDLFNLRSQTAGIVLRCIIGEP